jgi:hypothetical protein
MTERSDAGPRATGAGPGPLRREQVVAALCDAFASDRIGLQELEHRLEQANRVGSESELRKLLSDLDMGPGGGAADPLARRDGLPAAAHGEGTGSGPGSGVTPGHAPTSASTPGGVRRVDASNVKDYQTTIAVWSGRSRKGSWVPARRNVAIAFQGGIELDFREAVFGPGVTEVHAVAVMGAVDILVPPGVHLESSGFALMGAFEDEAVDSHPDRTDMPVIRLSGFALMGAVEVRVRLPGESERQARARRKRERRELDRPK